MNKTTKDKQNHAPLILFDGVCNLCSTFVQFVISRERTEQFRFTNLQSEIGRALMGNPDGPDLNAVVLIENGRRYSKSAAVLRIALKLDKLWPALYCFIVIPDSLRNLIYDYIGNRRYRWFGKTESCWLPTDELERRFVDSITDIQESEFNDMSLDKSAPEK